MSSWLKHLHPTCWRSCNKWNAT